MSSLHQQAVRPHKILWIHNYGQDGGGGFMNDIKYSPAWEGRFVIVEHLVAVRPRLGQLISLIRQARAAAMQCDIVHAQYGSLVGLIACFCKKPMVLSVRGSDFHHYPSRGVKGWIASKSRQLMTRFALLRADAVLCMSYRNRKQILASLAGLFQSDVFVVTDPAGIEFWNLDQEKLETQLSSAKVKAAFASLRLHNPVKRAELALSGVKLANLAGINVELVSINGMQRSEVAKKMKACDFIILTSLYEGWPNVIKEAMLLGLPFIATDVSDLASHANLDSGNLIVSPSSVAVACAIVERSYVDIMQELHPDKRSISFLPGVAARKLQCIYASLLKYQG
jgi:teichuronic acid biosynthesis glycosyltransferase TuaC